MDLGAAPAFILTTIITLPLERQTVHNLWSKCAKLEQEQMDYKFLDV